MALIDDHDKQWIAEQPGRGIDLSLSDDDKKWISEQFDRIRVPMRHTNATLQRDEYRNWTEIELGLTKLRLRLELIEEILREKR